MFSRGDPADATSAPRRSVLSGIAVATTAALAGCAGVSGDTETPQDSDGDGVRDSRDAAPYDDRTSERMGGDPPPDFKFAHDGRNQALTVFYASGGSFRPGNTDRLQVTVDGARVGDFPLPVTVGDSQRFDDVSGPNVARVVWIGPDGAIEVADSNVFGD